MSEVTVLMTTYNEEKNILRAAIDSILNQTLKEFKLLIVVDNPNNQEVLDTLREYCSKDNRVSFVVNEENMGLPLSLNKGIDLIETKYIARMDADDIADKTRLLEQLKFASKNPDIDVFGANIMYMSYDSNVLGTTTNMPVKYEKVLKEMKCKNVFNHPTLFGKTEVFKKYKYRNLKYAQDYDFTCRLLEDGCKLCNMPDCFLMYRLPGKKNKEKKLRQWMTYCCVQQCYINKCLSKTDIQEMVEKRLKTADKDSFMKYDDMYDEALAKLRGKKYIRALGLFGKCFVNSKFQRDKILNSVKSKLRKRH